MNATSQERPQLRLLLAEDDATERAIMSRLLANAGYQVEAVSRGEHALERIQTGAFHMLVTDWQMPGLDGVNLCRRVRETELPSYLYILMLTGNSAHADVVAGLDAGADDFIRKPADPGELIARLNSGRRALFREQALREASAQIRELSIIDPLVQAFNRRYLNTQLHREVGLALRAGQPYSVVMADLDRFKKVNDEYGHLAGDQVLHDFVARLRGAMRASDWIARFGGEEFLIALPSTALESAAHVAEKLRLAVASSPFELRVGQIPLSASFGVASLNLAAAHSSAATSTVDLSEQLLLQADAALYRSKADGRNRVSVS